MSSTDTTAEPGRRRRRLLHRLAWVLMALGVAASVLAGMSRAQHVEAAARTHFGEEVQDRAAVLSGSLLRDADVIAATRAILAVEPELDNAGLAELFAVFGDRDSGITGLGYVAKVDRDDLDAFAATLAADPAVGGDTGPFELIPAGVRPSSCLVRLAVANATTLLSGVPRGLDLCAVGSGAKLLEVAGRSGEPVVLATTASDFAELTAVMAAHGLPASPEDPSYAANALVVMAPVYRDGVVPAEAAERERDLVGWAAAMFDGGRLLVDALGSAGRFDHVSLERTADAGADTEAAQVASFGSAPSDDAFTQEVSFEAGGHWRATFASSATAARTDATRQGVAIALAGSLLAGLAAVLLRVLVSSREAALHLVDEKTSELQHRALHDALTDLPNRALILDRAAQLLGRARRHGTKAAALFVDLDGFKAVNDTLGHGAGDELLKAAAQRLAAVVRESDTLGRLGGDEFVVLTEGDAAGIGPDAVAERLLAVLREPFVLDARWGGGPVRLSASIGIAVGDRPSADDLLRDADVALYEAKAAGKDQAVEFQAVMQDALALRVEREADLHGAVERGELRLVYQPTFDLEDLTVTGVEALLRWHHPVHGVVPPVDFIGVAEETGTIVPIGRWVIDEACRQGAAWHATGHPVSVAVNVSARQLDADDLVSVVGAALARHLLPARSLVLEITESTLMRNTETTVAKLRALKELGVRIAIDDFGTGYSSLSYLKQFPVDALKIDRSFIAAMSESREASALLHTLVQLGRSLGLETLAEGIEEHAQVRRLQQERCDSGQGFLFARPLPADEVAGFLAEWPLSAAPATAPSTT